MSSTHREVTAAILAADLLARVQAAAIHRPQSAKPSPANASNEPTAPTLAPSCHCAPECARACKCGLSHCIRLPIVGRKIAGMLALALSLTTFAFAGSPGPVDADSIIGDALERCMCLRHETWLMPSQVPAARAAIRRERERNRAMAVLASLPKPPL